MSDHHDQITKAIEDRLLHWMARGLEDYKPVDIADDLARAALAVVDGGQGPDRDAVALAASMEALADGYRASGNMAMVDAGTLRRWAKKVRALANRSAAPADVEALREALFRIHAVTVNEPDAVEAATQASNIANEALRALSRPPAEQLTPEALAQFMHETYEQLAPDYGYVTREETAVEWETLPGPNKNLMIEVAAEVLRRQCLG